MPARVLASPLQYPLTPSDLLPPLLPKWHHCLPSDALAVDQAAAILQLPEPEVHVVRRQQGVADVREEELQEVLTQEVHLAPEEHADEAGDDDEPHVVRRQRLHLVHLPHEPQLWEEAHGLLKHGVGDQDLHGEPVVPGVEEEREDQAERGRGVHAEEGRRVLRGRVVELEAEEAQGAGRGGRKEELQVGKLRLHKPRLHGPHAARDGSQKVGGLRVDAEAIDGLILPDLEDEQE
mmetsp:Transcript_98312/g.239151  ORF Transcript_98312/g.239151 Transcript_98312/m.239151 type:complete len:235 (-) Transcript_98312:128-832(-)